MTRWYFAAGLATLGLVGAGASAGYSQALGRPAAHASGPVLPLAPPALPAPVVGYVVPALPPAPVVGSSPAPVVIPPPVQYVPVAPRLPSPPVGIRTTSFAEAPAPAR